MNLVGIFCLADIVHRNPGTSHGLHWDFAQLLHVVDQAIGVDVVIERSHLHVAGRQDEVGSVHSIYDVHRAQLPGCQLEGIDVHHDLAVLAPEGRRNFRTLHHSDLIADRELPHVVKLGLIQAVAFEGYQANRKARGIELQNYRGQGAGRQAFQVGEREIRDLRYICVCIRSRLEVNLDHADAQQRTRFHVVDPAGQSKEAL